MNCFRIQTLLSAYIDQELDAEERRLLRSHVFNCPDCSREMESLLAVKKIMGRLTPPEPLGDPLFLVRQELDAPHYGQWSLPHPYLNGRHLTMTAACISLFLLTSLILFPNRPQDKNNMTAFHGYPSQPAAAQSDPRKAGANNANNTNNDRLPEWFRRNQSSPILTGIPVSR